MDARSRAALFAAVLAIFTLLAGGGRADASPPGTLRASAAGDGHLWWAVERVAPAVPGRSREGEQPEYLLMHHATLEPAPTERFVMKLAAPPEAMAAEGNTVVLVTRPQGERKRVVLLTRAQRNEAVGHWFSEPRKGPKILTPLDERGRLLDLALVDGTLFVVRALRDEAGAESLGMSSIETGFNAEWKPVPMPPLDRDPTGQTLGWSLFREGAALAAVGRASGRAVVARYESGAWTTQPVPEADGVRILGAFSLEGLTVLVERADAVAARIVVTVLREGRRSAWAGFDEPARPWCVAPFGPDAALLELDATGRGTVRAISPSSNAPREAVTLMPPGFASGGWVHLLILGVVSLSLMLTALLFGSEEYLKARLGRASPAIRPPGAPLSRRFLAFAVDAVPAFFICWAAFGGSPARLLEHPILSANLESSLPGAFVIFGGWIFATLGDAILGRSIGKRLLGLMILGRDDRPARPAARILRSILSLASVLSPPVMLLAIFHPWGDGPAEMLTKTSVVDESAWAALPRPRPDGEQGS
jgi:uncharacterized RDD family membrane protein YckC